MGVALGDVTIPGFPAMAPSPVSLEQHLGQEGLQQAKGWDTLGEDTVSSGPKLTIDLSIR